MKHDNAETFDIPTPTHVSIASISPVSTTGTLSCLAAGICFSCLNTGRDGPCLDIRHLSRPSGEQHLINVAIAAVRQQQTSVMCCYDGYCMRPRKKTTEKAEATKKAAKGSSAAKASSKKVASLGQVNSCHVTRSTQHRACIFRPMVLSLLEARILASAE